MSSRSNALYTCLLSDLGYPEMEPSPLQTTRGFAKSYLASSLLRKYVDDISDEAESRALEKFLSVNSRCAKWQLECESWEDELVGLLKEEIYKFWNPAGMPLVSTFSEVLDLGRVGPGASIGASGNDFYSKLFSSQLTCTRPYLYEVYRRHFESLPLWASAEVCRAAQYGDYQVVEGSRIRFVPKTNEISRTICVEPTLNMFYQLGFGANLEARLKSYFGIDLSTQPLLNREMARLGSICGSFATIDLSSASDSLSLGMLKNFLPRDFYAWLVALRSPVAELPDGTSCTLEMVSTMGNGYTFPLQTMLFACVVKAVYRLRNVPLVRGRVASGRVDPGNFSVFGDDIICRASEARLVIRLLSILGFTVNPAKTFIEGPFRESCGSDFLRGQNVRPVFLKSLATQQDRCTAINLLNEWTARTGIPLPETVAFLMKGTRRIFVPFYENEDAGIKVPFWFLDKARYSPFGSVRYIAYRAVPSSVKVLDGAFAFPRRGGKRWIYNPDGLLVSFLQGSVKSEKIMVRHDHVLYRTKPCVAPNWDYMGPSSGVTPEFWRRWNTAVYQNLYG